MHVTWKTFPLDNTHLRAYIFVYNLWRSPRRGGHTQTSVCGFGP